MYAPPTGMIVNPTAQWIITSIQFIAAAVVTVWVILRREGDLRVRLLVLLGGGLGLLRLEEGRGVGPALVNDQAASNQSGDCTHQGEVKKNFSKIRHVISWLGR